MHAPHDGRPACSALRSACGEVRLKWASIESWPVIRPLPMRCLLWSQVLVDSCKGQARLCASPDDGVVKRPRVSNVVALLAGVVAPLLLGLAAWQFWGGVPFLSYEYSCSRSGQRVLEAGAGVVQSQVAGAANVDLQTYDCDSGSAAWLEFDAKSTPAETRVALLGDSRCRQLSGHNSGTNVVECKVKRHTVQFAISALEGGSRGVMNIV